MGETVDTKDSKNCKKQPELEMLSASQKRYLDPSSTSFFTLAFDSLTIYIVKLFL